MLLGIYEFSERDGQPDCRADHRRWGRRIAHAREAALAAMQADGGTPIGNAMIAAKRALDATGPHAPPPARRHRRREHRRASSPSDVAAAIGRRPEAERPSIYFVAFDIEASRFDGVRDAGGLVLAAANARS